MGICGTFCYMMYEIKSAILLSSYLMYLLNRRASHGFHVTPSAPATDCRRWGGRSFLRCVGVIRRRAISFYSPPPGNRFFVQNSFWARRGGAGRGGGGGVHRGWNRVQLARFRYHEDIIQADRHRCAGGPFIATRRCLYRSKANLLHNV